MMDYWLVQLEYFLRITLAGLCGLAIGFERKNRMKVAGTRTHLLVALASSLMIIVSKYGFFDVIGVDSVNLDPSRIAAGIVTGISFLGAGMIFVRKQEVSGVTTAAGVWATVGIGMAVGAGMYAVGIFSTLLILLNQKILHSNFRWLREPIRQQVTLILNDREGAIDEIQRMLQDHKIEVLGLKVKKENDGTLLVKINARFPLVYEQNDMIALLQKLPHVVAMEI